MRIIIWFGLLGSLLSLGSVFSAHHLYFDLLSHFRIQYIVLISSVLLVAIVIKRFYSALALVGCLAIHVFAVVESELVKYERVEANSQTVRVMTSNLLASNVRWEDQIEYIQRINPDIVVFQEYTQTWQQPLNEGLNNYPYRVEDATFHPFGIALYSKLPFADFGLPPLVDKNNKSVYADVQVGDATLRIFGTHPPPPASYEYYDYRNRQMQRLASMVNEFDKPLVVLGDLNTSPWSAHFQEFLQQGNLLDASAGHGILYTWPENNPWLGIPIDHILVNKRVGVSSVEVSSGLGSDHKAMWADVSVLP